MLTPEEIISRHTNLIPCVSSCTGKQKSAMGSKKVYGSKQEIKFHLFSIPNVVKFGYERH